MPETNGHREAIERMARQIVDNNQGKVSHDQARKLARDAALRHDKKHR